MRARQALHTDARHAQYMLTLYTQDRDIDDQTLILNKHYA